MNAVRDSPDSITTSEAGWVDVTLTLYEKVSLNFGSGVVAVALIGTLSYVSLGKLAIATRSAGDTEAVLEQVDMLRVEHRRRRHGAARLSAGR